MTFGETLAKLMKQKGVTIVRLCKSMHIKSQTTVTRILKDESSYEKTREFFEALKMFKPLGLLEKERNMLEKSLEVNKVGKDMYQARQEMLRFVNETAIVQRFTLQAAFGGGAQRVQTLVDLFAGYSGLASVKVYLLNCVFDGVIHVLAPYLRDASIDFTVAQFVQDTEDIAASVRRFIALLPVMNYKRYQVYNTSNGGLDSLNPFNNMMYVLKTTPDGRKLVDVVSFQPDDRFMLLCNQESGDAYAYYAALFDEMQAQSSPIKKELESEALADNLIEVSKRFLSFETAWQQLVIRPSFCFYTIDSDRLGDLCYPGALPDDKKKEAMEIHHERFVNYSQGGRAHTAIYTLRGLQSFMETGKFSDHLAIFRPFTQDEMQAVLRSLIEISEQQPMNAVHILKNEIIYNYAQYLLYGNAILFYCDGKADYEQMNFNYITNSQKIVDIFLDFVREDLIPKHCYSKEESLDILRSFLK